MLINVMLIKRNMHIKQFCGSAQASHYHCRLCTWIKKRGVWNKRGGWQNSSKLVNNKCWIRLGRVAKNRIINKWGVPSIQNSRVYNILCCSYLIPTSSVRANFFLTDVLNQRVIQKKYEHINFWEAKNKHS